MVADFMSAVGISRLICIEPHFAQFEGFCSVPSICLSATQLMCLELTKEIVEDAAVVAPDAGALRSARDYAALLGVPVLLADKRVKDVNDHYARAMSTGLFIIVDDMISTGASMCAVAKKLRAMNPAASIWVAAAHGLFLDSAIGRILAEGITRIFVTDTVDQTGRSNASIKVVGIAGLIADALRIGL